MHADGVAHALANQEVGAKLISLSTVESDVHLATAERKVGRAWEQLAGMAAAQVSDAGGRTFRPMLMIRLRVRMWY